MRKKLADLSANKLEEWLDRLSGSSEGTINLINIFLSQKHKLVKQSLLRCFLADCVSLGAKTVDDAFIGFVNICVRDDKYFALSRVDPSSISATSILATTMNSITFHQSILGRPKTKVKSVLPFAPKSHDVIDEKAYRDALLKITSTGEWLNTAGTLGLPFPDPKYVWFTHVSLLEAEIRADRRTITEATKIRDALGLITTTDNTYLLSIQFAAGDLRTISNLKMAQPGFADQGNKRFVVYLNRTAEGVYRDKWGLTVHLGKLRERPPQAINGVPERVCSAIPLSHIKDSINVRPLGWVVGNRGEEVGIDDDITFINRISGRSNPASIKIQVLRNANKP